MKNICCIAISSEIKPYLGGELMKTWDVNNSNLQKLPKNDKIHLIPPSPGM